MTTLRSKLLGVLPAFTDYPGQAADELTHVIRRHIREDEDRLVAALREALDQVKNVREYGEEHTPFRNGADQLARRIRRLLAEHGEAT